MKTETTERRAIFIPKELWEQVKKIANKNNRTIVGQIKEWIENYA